MALEIEAKGTALGILAHLVVELLGELGIERTNLFDEVRQPGHKAPS
jgi:hypothetical protein